MAAQKECPQCRTQTLIFESFLTPQTARNISIAGFCEECGTTYYRRFELDPGAAVDPVTAKFDTQMSIDNPSIVQVTIPAADGRANVVYEFDFDEALREAWDDHEESLEIWYEHNYQKPAHP